MRDICGICLFFLVDIGGTDDSRDAGITLSCRMGDLQSSETELCKVLNLTAHASGSSARLNVLELGTGCGIVGMTLASVVPNCSVHLSDLPEAREIVERNITDSSLRLCDGSKLAFEELDWDHELPAWLALPDSKIDLVLASDCTYNADSRYARPSLNPCYVSNS